MLENVGHLKDISNKGDNSKMSNTNKNEVSIKDRMLRAALIVLTVLVVAWPLYGTMYTFLSEDDFASESGGAIGAAEYQSAIVGSFYKTVNIYKTMQGCYTPMYLDHLFIPYTRFGLPGFHAFMFFFVASFIASLIALSFLLVKDKTASLATSLVALMSVFAMSYTSKDTDIMFWYTETLGFTLMMAFLFFALFLSILSFRTKGVKTAVCIAGSSVLAFLASGASLTVVAVNCTVLLAVIIIEFDEFKKRKHLAIPFVFGFIGAIINSVAPGNFLRADESLTPGHETLLDGIRDTFDCFFTFLPRACDIVFVLAIVALIALCIVYRVQVFKDGITGIKMIVVVVGVVLLQIAELFPAAYGSHSTEINSHLQIEHIITARLTFIFVALCFSQWLRENVLDKVGDTEKLNLILKCVCSVAVLLLLVLPASRTIMSDSFTARTYRDTRSGAFVRVYRVREYELSYFEMADDGTDAILYLPWDTSSESLPGMGLGADCEWFVNRSAANMFGVHTVTVLVP